MRLLVPPDIILASFSMARKVNACRRGINGNLQDRMLSAKAYNFLKNEIVLWSKRRVPSDSGAPGGQLS
jgi:hypothetical protein